MSPMHTLSISIHVDLWDSIRFSTWRPVILPIKVLNICSSHLCFLRNHRPWFNFIVHRRCCVHSILYWRQFSVYYWRKGRLLYGVSLKGLVLKSHHRYHLLHELFIWQNKTLVKVFLFNSKKVINIHFFQVNIEIIFLLQSLQSLLPSLSEQVTFDISL